MKTMKKKVNHYHMVLPPIILFPILVFLYYEPVLWTWTETLSTAAGLCALIIIGGYGGAWLTGWKIWGDTAKTIEMKTNNYGYALALIFFYPILVFTFYNSNHWSFVECMGLVAGLYVFGTVGIYGWAWATGWKIR